MKSMIVMFTCAGGVLAACAYGQTYEVHLIEFGQRPAQAWCVNGLGTPGGGLISTAHNAYRGFVGEGQTLPAGADTQWVASAVADAGRAAAVSFTIGDPGERAMLVDGSGATV